MGSIVIGHTNWKIEFPASDPRRETVEDPTFVLVIGVWSVYVMCMSRTNIEIDDAACAIVMKRFNLTTKREAVNFALNLLAAEAMSLEEARSMRGSGWVGDLDEMRA